MEYKYVVLRHQPSLYMDEKENFAVLVEGRIDRRGVIFAVGRSPEPSVSVSDLGKAISEKLPEILSNLAREAVHRKKPTEDVLDWIYESMTWNFQVSKPQSLIDGDPIYQVAFKLFSQHVAGSDQLVDSLVQALQRMTRPPEAKQRLGETFQAVVPVPEPELVPA